MRSVAFAVAKMGAVSLALAAVVLTGPYVLADPPSNYQLKFVQKPMDGVRLFDPQTGGYQTYWGHDELSTAWGNLGETVYTGTFMADDFADRVAAPAAHVTWWGSYMNPPTANPGHVQQFLISFEQDIPANGDEPSRPGLPILSQIVTVALDGGTPSPGKFTEQLESNGGPPANEQLFKYNAELRVPFDQQPNKVYWLKIVALVDKTAGVPDIAWGWHNRNYTLQDLLASTPPAVKPGEHIDGFLPDPLQPNGVLPIWHFQDDAVQGDLSVRFPVTGGQPEVYQDMMYSTHYVGDLDGPYQIGEYSKDLAFELYAVPEPGTVAMLLGAGAVGLLLTYLRRRRKSAV